MSVDINDITTDRLRRIQSQSQVLMFGINGQILLIDCPLVDSVRTRMVNDFAVRQALRSVTSGDKRALNAYQSNIPSLTLS